jgi:hypothetical protein
VTEVIVVETVAPGIADTSVSAEGTGMVVDTDIVTDSAVTGEGGGISGGAAYEPPATAFAPHSSEGTGALPTASSNFGAGLSAHEDVSVPATGHDQPESAHDPLGPGHNLPPDQASAVRAAERRDRGKVTSPERDTMYDESQNVGESGTMSNPTAPGDRNNVGRNG